MPVADQAVHRRDPQFSFVEAERVMETAERESAIPFEVENVELRHHRERCCFDAIIAKYGILDPALLQLAQIVRGPDTSNRNLTPESPGPYALAAGFHALSPSRCADDHALHEGEFPVYGALYAYCRTRVRV